MRRAVRLQLHWIVAALLLGPPALAQSAARFADAPASGREYWATAAARRLHERALEYERRGDVTRALVAYTDALGLDGAYGPAWLGLGRLRAAIHDYGEAERVLTRATQLEDVADDAWFERALLRHRQGRQREAVADLERAVAEHPKIEHVRLLSSWYVQQRAWPPALALWRRVSVTLEEQDADPSLRREATLQRAALQLLAAETDPVIAGAESRAWVRRSLASIARGSAR